MPAGLGGTFLGENTPVMTKNNSLPGWGVSPGLSVCYKCGVNCPMIGVFGLLIFSGCFYLAGIILVGTKRTTAAFLLFLPGLILTAILYFCLIVVAVLTIR